MCEDSHHQLFLITNQCVKRLKYVQGHCLQHRLPIIKLPEAQVIRMSVAFWSCVTRYHAPQKHTCP